MKLKWLVHKSRARAWKKRFWILKRQWGVKKRMFPCFLPLAEINLGPIQSHPTAHSCESSWLTLFPLFSAGGCNIIVCVCVCVWCVCGLYVCVVCACGAPRPPMSHHRGLVKGSSRSSAFLPSLTFSVKHKPLCRTRETVFITDPFVSGIHP